MFKGAEQLDRVEKIAKDLKKIEGPQSHHKHAEDRSKYPADYDSSSDYEVRKLADIIKTVEDLRRSQEDLKKQVAANQTSAQAQLKAMSETLGKQLEELRGTSSDFKAVVDEQLAKLKEGVNANRQLTIEKESQKNGDIDSINKRFKTVTTEIDEIRSELNSQVILLRRIEGVETKA